MKSREREREKKSQVREDGTERGDGREIKREREGEKLDRTRTASSTNPFKMILEEKIR